MSVASLSIVLPAFDEAANIGRAIMTCLEVADSLAIPVEIVVVDDGSRDATREIVAAQARIDGRVRLCAHARNVGYGGALKTGLLEARHDYVFFTDSDLQFDVRELPGLLALAGPGLIVCGYRARRSDPLGRRINGWIWSRLVDILFETGVRDVDCAFKVFPRALFERIEIRSIGAFVNTEILARARAQGFEVIEIAVSHHPRRAGKPTGANPRVILKAFRELVQIRRELRRPGR